MEEKVINEENTKKGNGPLIAVLLLIIAAMGCVIAYLLMNSPSNNKTQSTNTENQKQEESKGKELKEVYLTDEVAKKLMSYVPTGLRSLKIVYSGYSNKKLEVKDMDNAWLVTNALYKNERAQVSCSGYGYQEGGHSCYAYSIDKITTTLNSNYGKDVVKLPDKVLLNNWNECEKKETAYICLIGGGVAVSDVSEYFGVIESKEADRSLVQYEKAEKEGDNLYLYVKYARLVLKSSDDFNTAEKATIQLYKYGTGNELITDTILKGNDYCPTITKKDSWGNTNYIHDPADKKTFDEKILEQFKNKMTTYKLTFKVGEADSYTLLSVEPII